MANAIVKTVWIRYRSTEMTCDVAKGVGYRAIQGDEWRGPIRSSFRAARADAFERNAETREAAV